MNASQLSSSAPHTWGSRGRVGAGAGGGGEECFCATTPVRGPRRVSSNNLFDETRARVLEHRTRGRPKPHIIANLT